MRDLTPEELKLAPDWADAYTISSVSERVYYISVDLNIMTTINLTRDGGKVLGFNDYFEPDGLRAITKTFDMTKYEFSDSKISFDEVSGSTLYLSVEYEQWGGHLNGFSSEALPVSINKVDLIAMCKAIGIAAKDLN